VCVSVCVCVCECVCVFVCVCVCVWCLCLYVCISIVRSLTSVIDSVKYNQNIIIKPHENIHTQNTCILLYAQCNVSVVLKTFPEMVVLMYFHSLPHMYINIFE